MSRLIQSCIQLSSCSRCNRRLPSSSSLRCLASTSAAVPNTKTTQTKKDAPPVSSIPAGSPIKGLAYLKGETDPIAKPDHEYPAWLWTLMEPDMGVGNGDTPFRAIRRELNRENRKNIRKSNFLRAKK